MKISLNWIQDFIDLTEKDNNKIKEIITANTAEVETMERQGSLLENIILAHVEKLESHPNADKLKLATINDGKKKIKVVCGGSNLKENMKIAFANVGIMVKLGGEGGKMVKLKKVDIRGVESVGMICASTEIGLEEMFPLKQEKEIVDLSHLDAPLGTSLNKALGLDDIILDVDNHAITNRSDLFSHRGFAREFVTNGLGKWKKEKSDWQIPTNNTPPPIEVNIVNESTCSRYCAVYLTGIKIAESPDWLKKRLSAIGIRPISNIVDITNYVMMEWGMPLHAFDCDQLVGKNHIMRLSKKGEKVITLDEEERILPNDVVVLADEKEIYDLCGIMGGYQSGVKPETNRIWLHAPIFNANFVRRASSALSHHSEASNIYEKGVYNILAMEALTRATQLILQLCPNAKVASKVVDIKNYKPEIRKINLRHKQIERLVGKIIEPKEVEKILSDLGFELDNNKEGYAVTIPSWRLNDVNLEADLIEEIARIHGFDNIPFATPITTIDPPVIDNRRVREKEIKDQLVSFGFNEICTFSFLGPELLQKSGMQNNDTTIEVANPISNDMSLMRQSLLPRTLETIADNLRYYNQFRIFELSRTYFKKDDQHEERSSLIATTVDEDFRELQGVMEQLGFISQPSDAKNSHQHPGRLATLMMRGQNVGSLYQLHPLIQKNFDIKKPVIIAEVDIEALHDMNIVIKKNYKEIPKFPAIILDVSILIPQKNLAEEYFKTIKKTDKQLITKVELIDEYTGDKIDVDKRSITFSITYQTSDRTLTDEEVNVVHQKVIKNLENSGAEIRQ